MAAKIFTKKDKVINLINN